MDIDANDQTVKRERERERERTPRNASEKRKPDLKPLYLRIRIITVIFSKIS